MIKPSDPAILHNSVKCMAYPTADPDNKNISSVVDLRMDYTWCDIDIGKSRPNFDELFRSLT